MQRLWQVRLCCVGECPRERLHRFDPPGAPIEELLEYLILDFQPMPCAGILARTENALSSDALLHAASIARHVKVQSACTFSFANYSNPMRQFLYRCLICKKEVCLMCARKCHAHPEESKTQGGRGMPASAALSALAEDAESESDSSTNSGGGVNPNPMLQYYKRHLKPIGLSKRLRVCACERHTCQSMENVIDDETRIYRYEPTPVDTSKITLRVVVDHAQVHEDSIDGPIENLQDKVTSMFPKEPRPSQAGDAESELQSLVDILAKNGHSIWALSRIAQGWRYAPRRDNAFKCHPLLQPFERLDEESQSANRDAVQKNLKLIMALGFTIHAPEWDDDDSIFKADDDSSVGSAKEDDGGGSGLRGLKTRHSSSGSDSKKPKKEEKTEDGEDKTLSEELSQALVDVADVELTADLETLVELLARNYHEEWAKEQKSRGVVYSRTGGKLQLPSGQTLETSPLLVPFELLPAADQANNRSTAELFVKSLVALGYTLEIERDNESGLSALEAILYHTEQLKDVAAEVLRKQKEDTVHFQSCFNPPLLLHAASVGNKDVINFLFGTKGDGTKAASEDKGLEWNTEGAPHGWVKPDVNCCNFLHQTSLHLAARGNYVEACKALLANGASVMARDAQGLTPLATAAAFGYFEICKLLLRFGSDLQRSDR